MRERKIKDLNPNPGYARALKMFQDGRPLTGVAIELYIESPYHSVPLLGLSQTCGYAQVCVHKQGGEKYDLPYFWTGLGASK
jgi:hypothetical protein